MEKMKLHMDSVEEISDFVNEITKHDGNFSLTSGMYAVNAKSLMGIFTLDLSKPITLIMRNVRDTKAVCRALQHWSC